SAASSGRLARLRRPRSRLTWQPQVGEKSARRYGDIADNATSRTAGEASRPGHRNMAIEKCINEYATGEVIFEEGSTGRELFVVLDGKVDIAKTDGASRTVIVSLGKGEFFGEMAVIDGSARSASAIAATADTRVMRINHARFVYLVSQQPAFALMVMDALSKRLRASNAVTFKAAATP